MLGRGRSIVALVLLLFVVGGLLVTHGGDRPFDSGLPLAVLGLTTIAGSFLLFAREEPNAAGPVELAALLFPGYLALQLVPLPLPLLGAVSSTRAEVAAALDAIGAAPRFAPLTISAPATWIHLARATGCVLIFLLVRQVARKSVLGWWAASVPLVGLAMMEACWALTQALAGTEQVVGSYYNRNHLAGLLEMAMPFAAIYGIGVLSRKGRPGRLSASAAIMACTALAIALALFVTILFSLSKGGTFAALGSLMLMGVLALEGRVSGTRRWAVAAGVVLACGLIFVFLIPAPLVERFSVLASEDASEGRVPIWKDTLHLIRAYPLFGTGMGTFHPGLLRYQTAGLEFIWTAAHNDYLQSLAELGFAGFVFPAVVIGGAFVVAVHAATRGSTREARWSGLACAGSLAAFLIHSLSDFNAYILSNAMAIAWVAGLSAGVSPGSLRATSPGSHDRLLRRYVRTAGAALLIYSGAWLVFYHLLDSNPSAERRLCRFGVCETDAALAHLQGSDESANAIPVERLTEFLERDSANPSRWRDLGAALHKAGRIDAARYCLFRAVALAPNSPPTLLEAAKFQLEQGERRTALELVTRSFRAGAGDAFDDDIFTVLEEGDVPVADLLQHGLPDRRSAQAYLRRQLKSDKIAAVDQTWEWMARRGEVDDRLANEYTEYRLRANDPAAAARGWSMYAKTKDTGYPQRDRIFNGDFESDPTGNRFDWRIEARSGTTIDFDEAVRFSGNRSVRIRFDGTQNPGDIGIEQTVFLPAGTYRFQAHVKTDDVSTDQGVGFRIAAESGPKPLDVTTANVRGSNDWTVLESAVDAPPGGVLARVMVVRKPSLKFDNLIKGTAWIDQVSIQPRR